MYPHHVMGVGGRAWHDALCRTCLRERPLQDAVIIRGGAEQAAADQRNWRGAAHPITPCPCVDVASASVVAGGGLRPQVELCAVGLNLAPDGKDAKPDQGEQ